MSEFETPVDVANRALQIIGAPRIVAFSDDSVSASETLFAYSMLRAAELQRNNWRFAIRSCALRAIDPTVLLFVPTAWNIADIYPQGAIVSFGNEIWQALQPVPADTPPGGDSQAYWDLYFGPMAATQWQDPTSTTSTGPTGNFLPQSLSTSGYYAGELVYVSNGANYSVFLSLINGNAANPSDYPAWDPTVTYNAGETVGFPAAVDVTYNGVDVTFDGIQVVFGGVFYQSLQSLNLNQEPDTSPAAWQQLPIANEPQQLVGTAWLNVGGSLDTIRIIYPIGAGPGTQTTTRNAFLLPNGYLKEAPQDPRAGDFSFLGAPSNVTANDWVFQGDYITSSADAAVIILRFTADMTSVPNMSAMFCEGLAARIAEEVCEVVTQSTNKMAAASKKYAFFMGEARMSNAIENSTDQPPLDDYIVCRT